MAAPSVFSLDLDLDLFAGPFDLLLALILRDEVDLAEVPVAEVCVTYLERLAEVSDLDLEAASEFLVLVAALVELKSRLLLPDEDSSDIETVEEAADELAARLAEYARFRAAAEWLGAHREEGGRRVFRSVRAPLAPPRTAERPLPDEDPQRLADAIARLLAAARRGRRRRTCRSACCPSAASSTGSARCSTSGARSRSTTPSTASTGWASRSRSGRCSTSTSGARCGWCRPSRSRRSASRGRPG